MARRRYLPPDLELAHVSFKCVGDAFLMRPDPYTNFVIACALADGIERYGVRLYAFCFLSNHSHLLVGILGCRLDSFMQYVKSRIALALNEHRGRDGAFFKRRYRVEPILSDDAAVGVEQYVHQQPVKHGLVERSVEWPGLSSFEAIVAGKPSVDVEWFDEQAWREAGACRGEHADFVQRVSVPLTPLPHRQGLSALELRAQRRALVMNMQDFESSAARKRRDDGNHRRLPKPSSYATQDPNGMPARTGKKPRTPQPWAHGTDEQVAAYREAYELVMNAYDIASARYRKTGQLCPFPAGTFPPRIPIPLEVV